MPVLHQALNAARDFHPLRQAQVGAILAKTGPVAKNGEYELYKTTHHFDLTFRHPEYLG